MALDPSPGILGQWRESPREDALSRTCPHMEGNGPTVVCLVGRPWWLSSACPGLCELCRGSAVPGSLAALPTCPEPLLGSPRRVRATRLPRVFRVGGGQRVLSERCLPAALTSQQERVLIEILVAAVRQAAEGRPPAGRRLGKKVSATPCPLPWCSPSPVLSALLWALWPSAPASASQCPPPAWPREPLAAASALCLSP